MIPEKCSWFTKVLVNEEGPPPGPGRLPLLGAALGGPAGGALGCRPRVCRKSGPSLLMGARPGRPGPCPSPLSTHLITSRVVLRARLRDRVVVMVRAPAEALVMALAKALVMTLAVLRQRQAPSHVTPSQLGDPSGPLAERGRLV
jgi:hypothetical protein